jgi:hypothetical protein
MSLTELEQHEVLLKTHVASLYDHLKFRQRVVDKTEIVVFDIDGTALNDKRGWWPVDKTWPAFGPILDLYAHVLAEKYAVVFLTGRQDSTRAATLVQLESAGYHTMHSLIMYPSDLEHTVGPVTAWKDAERKKLKDAGFHLVACIGDQPMDVEGEHLGEHQTRLKETPCVIM